MFYLIQICLMIGQVGFFIASHNETMKALHAITFGVFLGFIIAQILEDTRR